jgi:hypothetical protein
MSTSISNFSQEVKRAWGTAYFTALNQDAQEMRVEHLIFGLHQVFGGLVLGYFDNPMPILQVIEKISKDQRHNFSLSEPFELGHVGMTTLGGTGNSPRQRILLSRAVDNVLTAAATIAKDREHAYVGLGDIMRALAKSPECKAILYENGARLRDDFSAADYETSLNEKTNALTIERFLKLCRDWKNGLAQVMCSVTSNVASVETSLGAQFQIVGKIGLVEETTSLVRIDAEGAMEAFCLIDLRGSTIHIWRSHFGDANSEQADSVLRIEIRLPTGEHCIVGVRSGSLAKG